MTEFNGKIAVVTGGAAGIGKTLVQAFEQAGATVCSIDRQPGCTFTGDLASESDLNHFADEVIARHGAVDFLINNAMFMNGGIENLSWQQFNEALKVGVSAPFWLSKRFAPCFRPGAAIINISSSRDRMSQPNTESYTAAKGGISALTHALAVSLAGKVRVNAISPGWIDTDFTDYQGPDAAQHPAGRVGNPLDIAHMALFLCSDKAGFITGENICIDGGMTRQMIYHGEGGWQFMPQQ
jgi:NAD(P)-dependent dehydrogenase (short-subunit alcohol dehydrogenase family)